MSSPTWSDVREFLRVAVLCVLWYACSSVNGVLGKWILSEFPHPMTVTMVQLASIAVYSRPIMAFLRIRPITIGWRYYVRAIVPLAAAKFLSSVLAHVSIWKVPVSYAHTVKASMPLFTVVLSRLFVGERHSTKIYLSLLPIVMGVAVATVTEVSFDVIGLSSALAATAGFSCMTIFTKKVMKETGVSSMRLLFVLGQLSCLMFLPVWLVVDFRQVISHPSLTSSESESSVSLVFLLAADGLCHWLQNILAFQIMSAVTPLTYSVANVTKRISIITVSLLMLRNHVTPLNVFGMCLAIFGVALYNKAKIDEKHARERLPTSAKDARTLHQSLWNGHANGHFKPTVQLLPFEGTSRYHQ